MIAQIERCGDALRAAHEDTRAPFAAFSVVKRRGADSVIFSAMPRYASIRWQRAEDDDTPRYAL